MSTMTDDDPCTFRPTWALPDSARLPSVDVRMDDTREALVWYDGPRATIFCNAARDKWWLGVLADEEHEVSTDRWISRWVLCSVSAEDVETIYARIKDDDLYTYNALRRRALWMRGPILVVDFHSDPIAAWEVPPETVVEHLPDLIDDAGEESAGGA